MTDELNEKEEWVSLGRIIVFGYDTCSTEYGKVNGATTQAFKERLFKTERIDNTSYLYARIKKVWNGSRWEIEKF